MTENNGQKRRPPKINIGHFYNEFKNLRESVSQLKVVVHKLRDILQVDDNWHSRVKGWIGREVEFLPDSLSEPIVGKLLYTDRYTLGVEVDGTPRVYNKGKIEYLSPA